jgi:subtilisin family serine protease
LLQGRHGRGSIFVIASGNGGFNDDSCAANGYASSIYTIAVGSADQHSLTAHFDEECAAKMVVTFSFNSTAYEHGNSHEQVVSYDHHGYRYTLQIYSNLSMQYTTALNGKCNDTFTGTSASAPLVSASIALSLQAK